jgi:uncharacterized protein
MKIVLADITDEGLDLTFEETLEPGPYKPLTPVKAALHVDKFGHEVFVRGTVRALLELECSRCLKVFPFESDSGVDVVYHPLEELGGEERHEIKDDELDTDFYRGDEVDIGDLVKEQVILSIPLKPLCSESCRGICPSCGTDLSTDTCTCETRETDPRLEILKQLLDKGKE